MEETRATILVTDDNLAVQIFICRVLREAGYHVLQSQDPFHALQLCREHPGPIHLLITDVLMPEMNGRDLASRATTLRKTMRVLYISGYVDRLVLDGFGLDGALNFMQKPFSPTALCRRVQEVLESAGVA